MSYWLGLIIALLGMSVIVGWDVISQSSLSAGDLLAMLAGVFYAGYLLTTQRIRAKMDTLPSLWVASATGTVLLLAFILATGQALAANAGGICVLGLGLIFSLWAGWRSTMRSAYARLGRLGDTAGATDPDGALCGPPSERVT